MANMAEEKLREAACVGDTEAIQALIAQNVNVNSQNTMNGWLVSNLNSLCFCLIVPSFVLTGQHYIGLVNEEMKKLPDFY